MSESDSSAAVLKGRAHKLAALLATGEEHGRLWRAEELAAMFRHQLSAPVMVDLGGFDAHAAARLRAMADAQGLLLKSFGDLFHHPAPARDLLMLVKDFAKANLDHPESGLPDEIARALYFTSIAAALVRLDERISKLSDADLAAGLRWAETQEWLDDRTRALLAQAASKLSQQPGGSAHE